MSEPIFNSRGDLRIGPSFRNTPARIAIDFQAGDDNGVALDVAAVPGPANERAVIKLGDYTLGQDTAADGTKNFGLLNSSGALVAQLAASGAVTLTAAEIAARVLDAAAAATNGDEALLYKFTMPLIVAPSGSIGDNGALTSGTANPLTYLKTYTWFPTGAIVTASVAGWYYTVWTTTTGATIFNNTWDGISNPTPPTTPVAFVTTGPGAFTGPTTEAVYFTLPCPAALVNSRYDIEALYHQTNTANVKTAAWRFSVIGGTVISTAALISFLHARVNTTFKLNGVADKQEVFTEKMTATAVLRTAPALTAETTSAAFAFAFTYTKADATDVGVIESVKLTRS